MYLPSILSPLLGLPSHSFRLDFPPKPYIHSPHACYVPCPSHPSSLDHPNYSRRRVQVMKLLIIFFFATSYYFVCFETTKEHGETRDRMYCCSSFIETSIWNAYNSVVPTYLLRRGRCHEATASIIMFETSANWQVIFSWIVFAAL
jgi:hypothetical protein